MAEEEKKGNEGQVKDLVKKLERGEITSKDARKELGKRGLLEPETWLQPRKENDKRNIVRKTKLTTPFFLFHSTKQQH